MEQAREQEILRITEQFVAEQEAGLHPRLEEYARKYPQYVDEITDFVTYYYAVEVGLPTDTTSVPSLSAGSRAALTLAWERVNTPLPDATVTLEMLARRQRFSVVRLAGALDLSVDLVERLMQREIDPLSLPQELMQRLVTALGQSLSVVRQALGLPEVSTTPVLAEARAGYTLASQVSFREALEASEQLMPSQRKRWLGRLEQEGL